MKLTTLELKQIIREELKKVVETNGPEFTKSTTGETRKSGFEQAKETGKGGITDQERGVIRKVQELLVQGAKMGNILQGNAIRYAKLLAEELDKIAGPLPSAGAKTEDGK